MEFYLFFNPSSQFFVGKFAVASSFKLKSINTYFHIKFAYWLLFCNQNYSLVVSNNNGVNMYVFGLLTVVKVNFIFAFCITIKSFIPTLTL